MAQSKDISESHSSGYNNYRAAEPIEKVECYGDYLILLYRGPINYFDIFIKSGLHVERVSVSHHFEKEGIELVKLTHVRVPRLDWSDRYFSVVEQSTKNFTNKLVLAGTCNFKG